MLRNKWIFKLIKYHRLVLKLTHGKIKNTAGSPNDSKQLTMTGM